LKSAIDKKLKDNVPNFNDAIEEIISIQKKQYIMTAEESLLEGTSWSFEESLKHFEDEIRDLVSAKRAEEIEKKFKKLKESVDTKISSSISAILIEAPSDMWKKITEAFENLDKSVTADFESASKGFQLSETENQSSMSQIHKHCLQQLRKKLEEEVSEKNLVSKLKERFEGVFRYDSKGIPRVWKPEDDIDRYYAAAKRKADQLLDLFSKADLSLSTSQFIGIDSLDEFVAPLLPPNKLVEIQNRFKRETDTIYIEAKRSIVAVTAKIPQWVLILLVVLGWNEMMEIIRSPFYLFTLFLVGGGGYLLFITGMLGPLTIVVTRVATEIANQLTEKIKEALASQTTAANPHLSYKPKYNRLHEKPSSSSGKSSQHFSDNIELKEADKKSQ